MGKQNRFDQDILYGFLWVFSYFLLIYSITAASVEAFFALHALQNELLFSICQEIASLDEFVTDATQFF